MYIIEMHTRTNAHSCIVLEKGDENKTYEQFSQYHLITNHAGDVDEHYCKWCAQRKLSVISL